MQIKFDNLSFSYNHKTHYEIKVLENIDLILNDNKITAIVGKNGAGKTTLVELINYFLIPTEGHVQIDNFFNSCIKKHKNYEIINLRKNIGFLSQFSENQLFEKTVLDDVMFGIKNFYPKETIINIENMAKNALKLVGIDSSFFNKSPLELSNGEKKRVAIAGIIAYNPKLLILDEITISLDIKGKKEILDLIKKINKEKKINVLLITHDMNVVLEYAEKIIVIDNNKIIKFDNVKDFFKENINKYELELPNICKLVQKIIKAGYKINNNIISLDELIFQLKKYVK